MLSKRNLYVLLKFAGFIWVWNLRYHGWQRHDIIFENLNHFHIKIVGNFEKRERFRCVMELLRGYTSRGIQKIMKRFKFYNLPFRPRIYKRFVHKFVLNYVKLNGRQFVLVGKGIWNREIKKEFISRILQRVFNC